MRIRDEKRLVDLLKAGRACGCTLESAEPYESMSDEPLPSSEIILYQTEDGGPRVPVRLQDKTAWLTQQHMAELFQTTKHNVGQPLKGLFAEGESVQDSVVKGSFTTAADGKSYATKFYNLDVIISVGYRVKSQRGTPRLREYIVKGFTTRMLNAL